MRVFENVKAYVHLPSGLVRKEIERLLVSNGATIKEHSKAEIHVVDPLQEVLCNQLVASGVRIVGTFLSLSQTQSVRVCV